MPKEPPEDDPILNSILQQLRTGLQESEITDDEIKDDLISGVQDSLRALFSMGISEMPPPPKPTVTVVQGGRAPDQPPTEKKPPNLRVADSDEDSEDLDSIHQTHSAAISDPSLSLHVIKPRKTPSTASGKISLRDEHAHQTIYVGQNPRLYRINVEKGMLGILLDGKEIDSVEAGQSMDVEAKNIGLKALRESGAHGSYVHLG